MTQIPSEISFDRPAGVVIQDLFHKQVFYGQLNLGPCTWEAFDPLDCTCLGVRGLFSEETKPGTFMTYKRSSRSIFIRTGNQDGKPTCIRLKRLYMPQESRPTRSQLRISELIGLDRLDTGRARVETDTGKPVLSLIVTS